MDDKRTEVQHNSLSDTAFLKRVPDIMDRLKTANLAILKGEMATVTEELSNAIARGDDTDEPFDLNEIVDKAAGVQYLAAMIAHLCPVIDHVAQEHAFDHGAQYCRESMQDDGLALEMARITLASAKAAREMSETLGAMIECMEADKATETPKTTVWHQSGGDA